MDWTQESANVVVIQAENVAFDLEDLSYYHKFGNPTVSEAHLEKFVILLSGDLNLKMTG